MVPAAIEPDPRAERFDALFRSSAGRVYGYAYRRSSAAEADEIVAETFLIAWRRLDEIPAESVPWLLGVARRVLANRRRADERRQDLHVLIGGAGSVAPDPATEVQATIAVRAALDRLPPAEREALALTAWEGLDAREAAAVVGCTTATFSVRLHRARRRFRKELEARERSAESSGLSKPDTVRPERKAETR